MPSRRDCLRVLTAAAALGGCAWLAPREPMPYCPGDGTVSAPDGPLTIDAHAHVFNGTDLPIAAFFQHVLARQAELPGAIAHFIGTLLQDVAWELAPTAQRESAEIDVLMASIRQCGRGGARELAARVDARADEAFRFARTQLAAAMRRRRAAGAPSGVTRAEVDAVGAELARLDSFATYAAYRAQAYAEQRGAGPALPAAQRSARGMLAFVVQNFQYRYVSIHDYLRLYNRPGGRAIDLMMPMLVDYDWPLTGGAPTASTLPDQIEVMEKLAIATGGRVHGFVPFDPFREVAHGLDASRPGAQVLVEDAVGRGFVGVKLYPSMGFRPYGNARLHAEQPDFWRRTPIGKLVLVDDLGRRLDTALDTLYAWCEREGVPVMAHAAPTNAPAAAFEELGGAAHWDAALARYPQLRVSFGHFGDSHPVAHGDAAYRRASALVGLMRERGQGRHAYADAAFFVEAMSAPESMRAVLQRLYGETADKGAAALANRFLYGTDWEMTILHGRIGSYLADFERLFGQMSSDPALRGETPAALARKFFGANAVAYAGLDAGGANRRRLQAFYERHGVVEPDWMRKVERAAG